MSCPPSNAPLPFKAFPGLAVNVQPCFNEVGIGSNGGYSTESVNYATAWNNYQSDANTNTNYYSQFTNTNTAYYGSSSVDTTTIMGHDTTTTTTMGHDTTTTENSYTTTTDYSTSTTMDMGMSMSTTTDYSSSTTTAMSMPMDMAMSTTTDMAMAMSTTTMDMAMPMPTPPAGPPAAYNKRDALEARTFQGGCQAPGFGQSMQLVPDFSQSRGVDFSKIEIIFVTIVSGLDTISIEARFEKDGSINVSIPSSVGGGQIFIFITIVDISGRSLNDNQVLFGPAVFEREFIQPILQT